jgi:hypothetical protein
VGTAEIVSLTLSIISLFVASVAAYQAYRLGRQQLHFLARQEFHKLLLDLDRELMRDPTLWGIYDDHPMHGLAPANDPAHVAKLEAFAFLNINLIELVFAFEQEAGHLSAKDRQFFQGWHGTCRYTVFKSGLIRDIIDRKDCQGLFGQSFLAWVKNFKEEWRRQQPAPAPASSPAQEIAHV